MLDIGDKREVLKLKREPTESWNKLNKAVHLTAALQRMTSLPEGVMVGETALNLVPTVPVGLKLD